MSQIVDIMIHTMSYVLGNISSLLMGCHNAFREFLIFSPVEYNAELLASVPRSPTRRSHYHGQRESVKPSPGALIMLLTKIFGDPNTRHRNRATLYISYRPEFKVASISFFRPALRPAR